MIHQLRGIRRLLLSQNKSRKYLAYAIGEIILVVIGIVIALQVSNWNENRKLKSREQVYLKSLHEEFINNKSQFEEVIRNHYVALKACNVMINQMPIQINPGLNDTVKVVFSDIFKRYTFNPTQGTVNALINSSSIELISNDSLRLLLIRWSDIVTDYQEEENIAAEFVLNTLDPFAIKNFQWDGDINDPRFDQSILVSFEFENIIKQRQQGLLDILESETNERGMVQTSIEKIIELTKT